MQHERFERVAAEHSGRVYAVLLMMTRDAQVAEDLLQETLIVAYHKMPDALDGAEAARYLREIARRGALHHISRSRGKKVVSVDPGLLETIAAHPEPEAARDPRRDALARCLEALPENARQLVDSHYGDGLTAKVIASKTGRTLSAVLVALHRIRRGLADCVQTRLEAEGLVNARRY